MGTKFSSAVGNSIGQNDFLNELCGAEPIRDHDEFWNKFASSSLLSISQAIISEQSTSESISSIGKVARAVSSSSVLNVGDYFPLSLLHPEILEKHLFKYGSLMQTNNLNTGSLVSFMLTLSQWLLNRVNAGQSEENNDESSTTVDRESILVTCNALVIFRFLIHRIIMDCENNADFLKAHLNHLPPGFKLSPNIYENYCYIDEEANPEYEIEPNKRISSPLVVRVFMESTLLFLSESRVTIHNYLLHLEVMNCLLVLFSTSLYGGVMNEMEEENEIIGKIKESGREHNVFLEEAIHIMKTRKHFKSNCLSFNPNRLIHTLLQNHIVYRLSKKEASPFQISIRSTLQKIFSKLGETATSLLYLPYNAYRNLFYKETKEMEYSERLSEMLPELLGRRSIMNLLLLIFYRKNDSSITNPYLTLFSNLQNSDDSLSSHKLWNFSDYTSLEYQPSKDVTEAGMSFEKLYTSLVRDFEEEECTVLTYALLHENKSFREFVLSRGDPETILLPLLHKIYNSKTERANHVYTLLIVLTLLTQDSLFVINTHKQVIPSVPWFTERILDEIRLGSLIVAVLISLVHYNITHQKDMYLNSFCLAIISNSGPYFSNIHTYTAQRMVTLTRLLTIKYEKVSLSDNTEEKETYLSLLKLVLETINCILTTNKEGGLRKNLRLVYELLYQRRVVKKLEDLGIFRDFIHNLKIIIEYFDLQISNIVNIELGKVSPATTSSDPKIASMTATSHLSPLDLNSSTDAFEEYLDLSQKETRNWSSETYMENILKASQFWTMSKAEQHLKMIPFFTSQFSEDAESESFFIGYLWNIIARFCESLSLTLPYDDEEHAQHTNESIQVTTV
ncbi:hypothetical protein C9374_009064 [Naegleria lovaniensis]|uniref:Dymeclin n=1 Tax=Naegleria lovaniensis TaxID=51637 RepID=A0AA88KH78_NAELO|nr:uncharacterized protein C9374_009064 [Naegleria lovaniensis]KAG2377548.1 hypothetical protein C9374_009064 [Naegleria lovaniensis]